MNTRVRLVAEEFDGGLLTHIGLHAFALRKQRKILNAVYIDINSIHIYFVSACLDIA